MSDNNYLPWTTRNDLVSVNVDDSSRQNVFVVKDVVKNEFFHFGELEFFFLTQLRNPVTVSQLRDEIHARFHDQIGESDIVDYVQRLAHDNLLVARRFGDGQRLYLQNRKLRANRWRQLALGLLSIRLPGIYPGMFLQGLRPLGWIFFNSASITIFLLMLLGTVLYAGFHLNELSEKLPAWAELVSADHIFLMFLGFILAKILHELGHALACQYCGHECSEMGVLLLVFVPCLYCDVSDMWTEKSRWKRIFVSLAGVYVEVGIAMACFWGWCLTVDGNLNQFLFGLMLVTSINTLFVNGNPLMRYDAYYALSDLVGIPNLTAVSRTHFLNLIDRFFFEGISIPSLQKKRGLLTGFAVASFIYRWFILIAIGWGIWVFFERLQVKTIGRLVVFVVLLISIIPMLASIKKTVRQSFVHGIKIGNTLAFVAILSVLALCATRIEFAHRVWGSANIQPSEAHQLFVPSDGFLHPRVVDGTLVKPDELIATVESEELFLDRILIVGQLKDVDAHLDSLHLLPDTRVFASELEFWKTRKSSLEAKLEELQNREGSLQIRAPCGGQLIALKHARIPDKNEDLSRIEGSVFDSHTKGCYVNRGQTLGLIGNATKTTGYIEVDEQEIEIVKLGQTVRLFVPISEKKIEGKVTNISLEGRKSEELLVQTGGVDNNKLPSLYVVEFEFDTDSSIRVGSTQKAVVLGQKTTFFKFVQRWWKNSVWY